MVETKKIKITVTDGGNQWDEEYEIQISKFTPVEYGQMVISDFNSELRPGEKPRTLVRAVFVDDGSVGEHQWEKQNLITLQGRKGFYDAMTCSRCGVKGKRYGIGAAGVELDKEFKARKYQNCDWMKKVKK